MLRLVLIVAAVILLAASVLNGFASRALFSGMFDVNSIQAVNSARTVIGMLGGFEEYAGEIIETWSGIPEEIRQDPSLEQYKAYFKKYRDEAYVKRVSDALVDILSEETLGDMYLAAIDPASGVILYLMDPEGIITFDHFEIGSWDQLTEEQLTALFPEDGSIGYYTMQDEEAGPIRVYGMEILPDEGSYRVMAMYDFPTSISLITATFVVVIYSIVLAVLILLIVLITRWRMKKRLVKPINSIVAAAEQYVRLRQEGSSSSCFSDLNIHTRDELEELGDVMAQMEKDIGIYEENLTRAAAEKEHIDTELSVATGIQSHMLPDAKTAFPDRSDFSIYASMNPAREVGGDFYDFFLIDEDHLGIVIADVSGKGIPAALFMMSSMIIINNYATLGFSPKEVLEKANTKICASNVLDMFVTVWFGILDLKTGEITAANAGHEYPSVCSRENGFELMHDRHGLVIGGMDGVKYKEYTFTLEKEGILYIYTDGVAEATNAEDELYGTDRMIRALNEAKERSVEEICQAVQADIDGFVKEAPQFDDITMVCIRYHGKA